MADRVATIDDLKRTEGKAELIAGRIVVHPYHGHAAGRIMVHIMTSIHEYCRVTGRGIASVGNLGYVVPTLASGRQSFCTDVAYYNGPLADKNDFIPGPPTVAFEVHQFEEVGPVFDEARAARRHDFFEAGTLVVRDVDPETELVKVYRADRPERPDIFGSEDEADAEPAMPGWSMKVGDVFDY